ncbi:DUF1990 family protein [Streptomyces tsukubensis]|uniref:DUF1990 domain-containing protein n=1 Tax=Streptomyces tsukubensis TaxID=83656 RepID=A0A1V4A965_9ACTN|nr:DUF1990 family protein [Streptomyces tsukubensis]OON78812.1 hypothetical protein B1H18_15710 [Streptomyces tsukubensis]QFR94289.1 DUF1990 family protein [Streptomyces tsukubensis]
MSASREERRREPSRGRHAGTLARFPAGIAIMSWRYLWRTCPLHRTETEGDHTDLPPRTPPEYTDSRSKALKDGSGPMFHRTFTIWIEGSSLEPDQLMTALTADLNRAAPSVAAVFTKTLGDNGAIRVGDEYRVQMPGPWDGPVRVVHRDATSFRFQTLSGHLEAGQIEFRARVGHDHSRGAGGGTRDGDRLLVFEVEAWSRAGDRWAEFLYSRLRVAKEIQLNMWVHFCLRAAAIAGGKPRGGVTIETRSIPASHCREAPAGQG